MMKQPPPQNGAIGLSFDAFIGVFPVVILAVALHLAVFAAPAWSGSNELVPALIDSAITALVAFAAHNFVVTRGARRNLRALGTDHPGAFLSFLALSFLIVFAVHGAGWFLENAIAPLLQPTVSAPPTSGNTYLILGVSIAMAIALLVLIGGFGTMLPAIVDGGDSSASAAWNRKVKGPIAFRLIGAMVVALIVGFVILLILVPLLGGAEKMVSSPNRQLIVGVVNLLLNFYLTTLVATILSKAYLGSYTETET